MHNVIANFIPTTFNPGNKQHLAEFHETNKTDRDTIVKMPWAKPIERRRAGQTVAHLLITVNDVNIANELILKGAIFCNYRATIEKCKRDPIRCLKCQKYARHMAHECTELNTCGMCRGAHMTNGCAEQNKKWCVACNSNTHLSWDRDCPTLAKKTEEFNSRNPVRPSDSN